MSVGKLLLKYYRRYSFYLDRQIGYSLAQVNAWNPKSIDEPDYDSILNGFTMASELLDGLLEDQLLPILHNAMYFLLQV